MFIIPVSKENSVLGTCMVIFKFWNDLYGICINKDQIKKYHTVRTVPISDRKIVETKSKSQYVLYESLKIPKDKWKTHRQHHGQNHRTNNDLQSTTYKTNDRETLFAPVLLFLLKIGQYVMNDEKAGL